MPYPNSIQSFTFKRNNIDKVVADDVNSAYTEITEIQRQLGGVVSGGIGVTTSTWGTGTFGTTISNWLSAGRDGLAERLANIEAGLYEVLFSGSTFAKTNIEQTFTEVQKLDGKPFRYHTALQIKESTWTQADPALSSNRAGLLFGETLGSWSMGQDSQGNGTRDFFVYGGASPTEPNLRFHIAVDGSVSIPNNSLNVGTGTTDGAYRLQVSDTNAGMGLVSTSSAGSNNRSWIDFKNTSYASPYSVRGNIYYDYNNDSLGFGTSTPGPTGTRTNKLLINSTGSQFFGAVTLRTGDVTEVPLVIPAGGGPVNAPIDGAVEYDGKIPYFTVGTNRGQAVLEATNYISVDESLLISNVTTAQSIFDYGLTLDRNVHYEFEVVLYMYTTSNTAKNVIFSLPNINTVGGSTISMDMNTFISNTIASSPTIPSTSTSYYASSVDTTTGENLLSGNTAFYGITTRVKGLIRTSGSPTLSVFNPTLTFVTASPGGGSYIEVGSYAKITALNWQTEVTGASGPRPAVGKWV